MAKSSEICGLESTIFARFLPHFRRNLENDSQTGSMKFDLRLVAFGEGCMCVCSVGRIASSGIYYRIACDEFCSATKPPTTTATSNIISIPTVTNIQKRCKRIIIRLRV